MVDASLSARVVRFGWHNTERRVRKGKRRSAEDGWRLAWSMLASRQALKTKVNAKNCDE